MLDVSFEYETISGAATVQWTLYQRVPRINLNSSNLQKKRRKKGNSLNELVIFFCIKFFYKEKNYPNLKELFLFIVRFSTTIIFC